jgi:hypothetical protein
MEPVFLSTKQPDRRNTMEITLTEEQVEKREQIRKAKEELKLLAAEQKKDKIFLSTDHRTHPKDKWGYPVTGEVQNQVSFRASKITRLHIEYNKMRGKPWHMHEYKD